MNTAPDHNSSHSAEAHAQGRGQQQTHGTTHRLGESAQHIWLAGIGALGRVQQQGSRLFESLVHEGEQLERRNRDRVRHNAETARERVNAQFNDVKGNARRGWNRFVHQIEEQIHQVLMHLHVPKREELDALRQEVTELRAQIARLHANQATASRTATTPHTPPPSP